MSLRHIVLWKLAAEDPDTRAAHAEQIAERMLALPAVIAEIERIEVGSNVAYPERNWDIALVIDFADVAALERYQEHPAHRAAGEFVRAVVSDRASVDYLV